MSEARVVQLDDYRKPHRRQDPPFMMLTNPAALLEWCKTASLEAAGVAFQSLLEEFCRGEVCATEEEAAARLRHEGRRHVQTRRLKRIKERSPDSWALIEEVSRAARAKYDEPEKGQKNFWKNRSKKSRNPQETRQIPPTEYRTPTVENSPKESSTVGGETPADQEDAPTPEPWRPSPQNWQLAINQFGPRGAQQFLRSFICHYSDRRIPHDNWEPDWDLRVLAYPEWAGGLGIN